MFNKLFLTRGLWKVDILRLRCLAVGCRSQTGLHRYEVTLGSAYLFRSIGGFHVTSRDHKIPLIADTTFLTPEMDTARSY